MRVHSDEREGTGVESGQNTLRRAARSYQSIAERTEHFSGSTGCRFREKPSLALARCIDENEIARRVRDKRERKRKKEKPLLKVPVQSRPSSLRLRKRFSSLVVSGRSAWQPSDTIRVSRTRC